MIDVLRSAERASSDYGTLAIRRTFAADNPKDPYPNGLGALISIADTYIAPAAGFPMHAHEDMEIISYIADGAMAHEDSLGNGSVIATNEVQRMSAGTGIVHSEFNPSDEHPCRCLQIWIRPREAGLEPSYQQIPAGTAEGLTLIGSGAPTDGAVTIHQDVALYAARLAAGGMAEHRLKPGRRGYVFVSRGTLGLNGVELAAGDGAALTDEAALSLRANGDGAAALVFDLA